MKSKKKLTAAVVSVCRWKHVREEGRKEPGEAWPCPPDCEAELSLATDSDFFSPYIPPEVH
jgi:hypothetical protein